MNGAPDDRIMSGTARAGVTAIREPRTSSGQPVAPSFARWLRQGWWLILFGSLLLACFAGWLWDYNRRWTVEKAEERIRQDLPKNPSREEIEAWLDRQRIPHAFFADAGGDQIGNMAMPQFIGLNPKDLSGVVRGEIPRKRAWVHPILPGRIRIYFFFDKDGKHAGTYVYPDVDDPSP
jgi:hypothetical protein